MLNNICLRTDKLFLAVYIFIYPFNELFKIKAPLLRSLHLKNSGWYIDFSNFFD